MFRRPGGVCVAVWLAVLTVALTAQFAAPTVGPRQLVRDLEILAADDMEGRRVDTPGSAKARSYIVERFRQTGLRPIGGSYEHPFSLTGNPQQGTGVNLLGRISGQRPAEHYILVTAHYDHLGIRNGQVYNGAGDNASGVAALLAVAAHFSWNAPEHPILFAALDAEEIGLAGARAFLNSGVVSTGAILLNVNIDMIARDASNVLYAAGTYHYPFLKPYLEGVEQSPVELRLGRDMPGSGEQDWTRASDHYEFHKAGIPFIYFGVEDAEQHHKPTDDAATIHAEFFVAAAQTIVAAMVRLDANLGSIRQRR